MLKAIFKPRTFQTLQKKIIGFKFSQTSELGYYKDEDDRFFVLNFDIDTESLGSEFSIFEENLEYIHDYEDRRIVLLAAQDKDSGRFTVLFNCENEKTPYDFIRNSPIYKAGYVQNNEIEEIEISRTREAKELALKFTYLSQI